MGSYAPKTPILTMKAPSMKKLTVSRLPVPSLTARADLPNDSAMSVEWMISGHENDGAATVLTEGNDQNRGTNAGIINTIINITVDVLALFPVLFMLARTPTLALSAKAPLCQLGCYFPIQGL